MIRCIRCVMPSLRPDVPFVDGICAACSTYQRRPQIDWRARSTLLEELLDRHHGECIVPSSGGKDSTYQAITLKEMGAHVTVVTARTCHLTPIGRQNIDNLARHCKTIEYVPEMRTRAKLNRLGLRLVGDVSWAEHAAIFTTPFKAAVHLNIPLIFYGENPQNQYGGPPGTEKAQQMTQRWVSEFGGFLGLRARDLIGQDGITERDMWPYMPPDEPMTHNYTTPIEAHFLGQYLEWDSHHNAKVAMTAGMRTTTISPANWWHWENLDNAQTGLHDYLMFRKYGYGRGCAQISVDVRAGLVAREWALKWVEENDGLFPERYCGVDIQEVLVRIDMSRKELMEIIDQFTDPVACSRAA